MFLIWTLTFNKYRPQYVKLAWHWPNKHYNDMKMIYLNQVFSLELHTQTYDVKRSHRFVLHKEIALDEQHAKREESGKLFVFSILVFGFTVLRFLDNQIN